MSEKKHIFITGGASGIGKAIAEAYMQQGCFVTILDRDVNHMKKMRDDHQSYQNLILFEGDVRYLSDINGAIESTVRLFGGIDVLIYCAGIYPDHRVLEMTEEEWDRVLDVNLKGAFLCCQRVASQMIRHSKKGHMITISSGSYRSGRVGSSHYCASKAGLVMFTKVLAMELAAYGIKANSISPGLVDNSILDPEYKDVFSKRIPIGRIGQPSDIASFITTFTELDNEYITGQVIAIDGGLSAGQYGLPMSNK